MQDRGVSVLVVLGAPDIPDYLELMCKAVRVSRTFSLGAALEDFIAVRSSAKPSRHTVKAWRSDIAIVAELVPGRGKRDPLELDVDELTKAALRAAFGTFSDDHAKASITRAWSSWNALFDHFVAEDIVEGNPMPAIVKPKRTRGPVKVIRGDRVVDRLLEVAATRASDHRFADQTGSGWS